MVIFLLGVATGGFGTAVLITLLYHFEGRAHRRCGDRRHEREENDRVIEVDVSRCDEGAFPSSRPGPQTWVVARAPAGG